MSTYRILDHNGDIVDKSKEPPDVKDEEAIKMYKDMLTGAL